MFCTSCGIRNAADSNFCKQCGTRLEKPTATKIHPEDFDRALPDEEQVSALIERAYLRRKEGDLDGAIALCIEALHLPTESTSAHSLLGQLYEENGDHEAAIREYERVLALNPGSIADRVKLDELRNGTKPGQHTARDGARPATRVVLSDDRRNRVFDLDRFTAVSVPLVLVLLGGVITLLLVPHNNPATGNGGATGTGVANTNPNSANLTMGAGAGNGQTGSNSATGPTDATKMQGALANSANSTIATNAGAGTLPAGNARYSPLNLQQPTNQSTVPAPNSNSNIAVPDRSTTRTSKENSKENSRTNPAPTGNNLPDNRSRGNGRGSSSGNEDSRGVVDSGDSHIRIPVEGEDGRGTPSETPIAKIEVVKPTPGGIATGGGTNSNAPSSDARAFIKAGQDRKLQKEYRGAIEAFTKALANAGNEKGYVLQQRALCIQKLGDQSSAHNDFASAIDEYRKLETTDPETAADGIRACQSGLKISGN